VSSKRWGHEGSLTKLRRIGGRWAWRSLALDVREDSRGEFFLISWDRKAVEELVVLDVQPRDGHLLLLSRENGRKHRFLLVTMRRQNAARIRQGEWFFVPVADIELNPLLVLRNEPLVRRRGGKPHTCEQLYRYRGDPVYVSPGAPHGLTETEYGQMSEGERRRWSWRMMRRNPKVYARGGVRHADHATVTLDGRHEVFANTEHLRT
jgi:hypothetical protein